MYWNFLVRDILFDSEEENWYLIGSKLHQYFNVYFKKKEDNIFFNTIGVYVL